GEHRLRRHGHERHLRQGAAGVPDPASTKVLTIFVGWVEPSLRGEAHRARQGHGGLRLASSAQPTLQEASRVAMRCWKIGLLLVATSTSASADDWKPAPAPLMTRWAKDVSPDKVHPDYPRPQMVREKWQSLNGLWQFAEAKAGDAPPLGRELNGRILV